MLHKSQANLFMLDAAFGVWLWPQLCWFSMYMPNSTWSKSTPEINWLFFPNPYKIEVIITSLIGNASYQTFVTLPYLQYNLNHVIKLCLWRHGRKFRLQNAFNLRRPRVVNFGDIIKIGIMFVKATFKDAKKVKRIRNYVLKRNLYLYFLIQ